MDPWVVVDPGIIGIGVHALVDDHGQPFFGFVQATDNAKHFIHHRLKMFAVMDIAGIDAVV